MPFSIGNRAFAAACGRLSAQVRGATSSAWGHRMQRTRAGLARARQYPELLLQQLENARRVQRDLPLLPVPEVPDEMLRPDRLAARNARKLAKRREEYEKGKQG